MQDRKTKDQFAGAESAGLETASPIDRGGKCGTGKCGTNITGVENAGSENVGLENTVGLWATLQDLENEVPRCK